VGRNRRFGLQVLLLRLALEIGGKSPQLLGNEGVGRIFRRTAAVFGLIQEILLRGHVFVVAVGILTGPNNANRPGRFRPV
jgi:hypothetical protein